MEHYFPHKRISLKLVQLQHIAREVPTDVQNVINNARVIRSAPRADSSGWYFKIPSRTTPVTVGIP